MASMGMNYGDLEGDMGGLSVPKPTEQKNASRSRSNSNSPRSNPQASVPFEMVEDVEEEYDDEEDVVFSHMEPQDKATVEKWLAQKETWVAMKGLGKGYESGARFVPIVGDGNCFWNAVSTNLTANKNCPEGHPRQHDTLRQRTVDKIIALKDRTGEGKLGHIKRCLENRKTPLVGA
jgi:hypothetical protein